MDLPKKTRKGFTLVELVIALTVVAIVTVMVVSFILMINRYFRALTYQHSMVESLSSIERNYAMFLSAADDGNYDLLIDTSGESPTLIARDRKEGAGADERTDSVFSIRDDVCTVEIPGAGETSFECESMQIVSIVFSEPNENGTLVHMTVTYELRTSSKRVDQGQSVFSYLVRTRTGGDGT